MQLPCHICRCRARGCSCHTLTGLRHSHHVEGLGTPLPVRPCVLQAGVVSEAELEACINIEFNPVRVSFGGQAVWTRDVLNLGASPARLVDLMRRKLEAAGGHVYERTGIQGGWAGHELPTPGWGKGLGRRLRPCQAGGRAPVLPHAKHACMRVRCPPTEHLAGIRGGLFAVPSSRMSQCACSAAQVHACFRPVA